MRRPCHDSYVVQQIGPAKAGRALRRGSAASGPARLASALGVSVYQMPRAWLSQDVMGDRRLSWRDYLGAAGMSLLMPLLVVGLQSVIVMGRGHRLDFAMLSRIDVAVLSSIEFWAWTAAIVLVSFLVLLPFLRLPLWRRIVFVGVCAAWTWIALASEGVTRGYEI